MTEFGNDLLFTALIACITLLVAGYLPTRKNPFVLRLAAAASGLRHRWYRHRWLRRRAWEVQHPITRRAGS